MELLFNSYRTFILYIHTSKIDYQKWIPLCNRSYFDKLITLNHPIDPWIDSFNFIRNIYRSSTYSNLPPINGFRAHLATQQDADNYSKIERESDESAFDRLPRKTKDTISPSSIVPSSIKSNSTAFLFSREFPLRIYIYIYLSLAMQRDLCVSRASLPVLGVHLCDRFAMMYDSRVSLSTRASGSFPSSFPF